MKKQILTAVAALVCILCTCSAGVAQTAFFSFNDFNGAPSSGTYGPGQSFTFSLNLTFAPGGNVTNLAGLSYWLTQNTGGPFSFSITDVNTTGSIFNQPQTTPMTYPQTLAPSNASDLGAYLASAPGVGAGTYFIARITITIAQTAANGTYNLSNTFAGAKTSVVTDDGGRTFAIAQSTYQLVVAPDTGSTLLLLSLSAVGVIALARRQQLRA
ncbi:MAG: hypothetical protein M3032_06640 [Verrucomicrobiota bacterium]|nr:hypothetical protein [Verrucomicrobiota bacterium]